jgi:cytochrome P450
MNEDSGMILSDYERLSFQQDPCLPGHPDPYPIYAALLEEGPVHWCEGPGLWIVLGHPECESHMRDDRCSRQDHLDKLIQRFGDERIFQRQKGDLPFMDVEVHGRVRHHVMAAFRSIDLEALDQFCMEFLRERLEGVTTGEWIDLMPLLANPLPVVVTGHLMGVPGEQQGQVLEHVGGFVRARGLTQTEATASGGDAAMDIYRRFFVPLLQERRRQPGNDVLSRLIGDPQGAIELSDEQLLLIVSSNFYTASIYTVPLLISNAALQLAREPALLQRLKQEPSLLNSCVEELLRFDPPAQALNVSAVRETIELGSCRIPAGDSVTALVGAANRDPRVFVEPNRFLLDRQPNPHLSFAPGLHQCLGLHLARLELRAVLRAWVERFERLDVDEARSKRLVGDRFRGFERLMIRFS